MGDRRSEAHGEGEPTGEEPAGTDRAERGDTDEERPSTAGRGDTDEERGVAGPSAETGTGEEDAGEGAPGGGRAELID